MRDLLQSLSLWSGALVVGLCSAVFAFFLARVHSVALRWLLLVTTPFAFSYSLYWSPVWLGANASEYSAWALVAIVPWYLAGLLLSVFVGLIVIKSRQKRTPQHG